LPKTLDWTKLKIGGRRKRLLAVGYRLPASIFIRFYARDVGIDDRLIICKLGEKAGDMEQLLIRNGIDWIAAIQGLGEWLKGPMLCFSFLGSEEFFLLFLPALYWCVNSELGVGVGFILLTSNSLNHLFKVSLGGARPYWVSDRILPLGAETSFGIPSGHAQNALGVWGLPALYFRKTRVWIGTLTLVFLIGFSRLYLGMHFIHDVIAGWLLGLVILWLFSVCWKRAAVWLPKQTLGFQVTVSFILSVLFILLSAAAVQVHQGVVIPDNWRVNAMRSGFAPDPYSLSNVFTPTGTLFGLACGLAVINHRGGFQATGSVSRRVLRYVIGMAGVLFLWFGLGQLFPRGEYLAAYILRYIRYALLGFWVSAGAPWLFGKLRLVETANR
jgi:membrane-associated phospholipid phosphatase